MRHEDRFRAMDTDIDVLIESHSAARPLALFASVRVLFEQQEGRFSRFRSASLVSRLNAGEVVDDAWLAAACRMAFEAHRFSGGMFNPLILESLERAGYSRTFDDVTSGGELSGSPAPEPADGLSVEGTLVRLRSGRLDLGGIVKGWTVDLAIEMLVRSEPNVLVNAGGDLRCAGSEEGREGWLVSVASPDSENDAWEGVIIGALATSTTRKRRWKTASGANAHHLIDPRNGLPASEEFVQVSAWDAHAWRAECWAKAIVIGGEDTLAVAQQAGVRVLAFRKDEGETGSVPA